MSSVNDKETASQSLLIQRAKTLSNILIRFVSEIPKDLHFNLDFSFYQIVFIIHIYLVLVRVLQRTRTNRISVLISRKFIIRN